MAKEGQAMGLLGQWTERNIANMDQTPLPFTFSDGDTYAHTGGCVEVHLGWKCGSSLHN